MQYGAFEQSNFDLTLKLSARPPLRNCPQCIELALFGTFALTQDDQVVCPRQLSQQCRDFWCIPIGLIELPHSKQVRASKPAKSWLRPGKMLGQLVDHPFPPF